MNKNQKKNSILLCLDLEEGSRELAECCNQSALDWDWPVQVLHVHSNEEQGIEDAESYLNAIVNETLDKVNVSTVKIVIGTPEEQIVEFANEIANAPIIMLGRRKRTIADRIYVGSTTSAVISLSTYPVIVVPLNSLK